MDFLKRLLMAACLSACSESAIAQETPQPPEHKEAWWDSPWGEADRLGNVNNLSPEGVKKAAGLVKTGKVYALGIPTAPESAAYGTRKYQVERTPGPNADYTPNGSQRVTSFDEKITSSMGIGTQIDGFGHLGVDHHYYNGVTGKEVATSRALQTGRYSADRDARRADRHDPALCEADARSRRHLRPRRDRGGDEGAGRHHREG